MKTIFVGLVLLVMSSVFCMAQTDVSLFFKKDQQKQLDFVESNKGNLFNKLGHHGPAIENPWYGLRMYFDKKTAIDVYSKSIKRLEIKEKHWYPSKKEQIEGWGADYYKVGKSLGLGGVKLWDNGQIIDLHPVTRRTARVIQYGDSASMEMVSEGVLYKGKNVDISVKVTVYSSDRRAKVEASTRGLDNVQFVTGINYFDKLTVVKTEQYIATWGIHPEDVAAEKIELGAALFIPVGFNGEMKKQEDQYILISDSTQQISFEIISASEREKEFKSMDDFIDLLEEL